MRSCHAKYASRASHRLLLAPRFPFSRVSYLFALILPRGGLLSECTSMCFFLPWKGLGDLSFTADFSSHFFRQNRRYFLVIRAGCFPVIKPWEMRFSVASLLFFELRSKYTVVAAASRQSHQPPTSPPKIWGSNTPSRRVFTLKYFLRKNTHHTPHPQLAEGNHLTM